MNLLRCWKIKMAGDVCERLLVEGKLTDAAQKLRGAPGWWAFRSLPLKSGSLEMLHALWTLDGLGQLEPADLNRIPVLCPNQSAGVVHPRLHQAGPPSIS